MSGEAWRRALLVEVAPEDFTESEALALIQHDHPSFSGRSARWLEHGWDNRVLEVDGDYIFRFPRSETFPSELELEVLRRLRGRVPVAIPEPEYQGRTPRYMGYRKLDGAHFSEDNYLRSDQGERSRLAQQIAEFFWSVHATLDRRALEPLGIAREDWRPRLDRELAILEASPFPGLEAFARAAQSDYEQFESAVQDTVVLFDDLQDENMLLDVQGHLRGVIDFGDVSFGDPHDAKELTTEPRPRGDAVVDLRGSVRLDPSE